MTYRVINKESINNLQFEINKLMEEGWKPQGGVCVTSEQGYRNFYQAMIFEGNSAKVIPITKNITFRGHNNPIPKEIPVPYQQTMN